jgi:beta-hydroxyacyl-ACP dehydratase FabZ
LGHRLNARIWAQKTGHKHHIEFVKVIKDHLNTDFFDIYDILKWMPHRYPFLLIDRIVRLDEEEVVGYKNVTFNEPFFTGHFPGNPVMPGVLVLEAMAQVGGFLLLKRVKNGENKLLYFSGADKVRFRRPVRPGDRVVFKVRLIRFGGRNAIMSGEATVDGEPTASATMMASLVEL